jgi:hypothetical protein
MKDIKSTLIDFRLINNFLGDCIDQLHSHQVAVAFWEEYFETHLFKFNLLNASLIREFDGIEVPATKNAVKTKTWDISALYLMARSQLETYFILKYLYLNVTSDDQGAFRYFLYEYGGLCIRQEYSATTPEHIAKKKFEADRIEELKTILQNNSYFQTLPDYKQKDLLNRQRPKEIGWSEIISESGVDEIYFNNWKYYSNYAHSEFIEAMQLKSFFLNPSRIPGTIHHTLVSVMMFPSMLITSLVVKYPILKTLLDNQTLELRTKIEIWNKFGLDHSMPKTPEDTPTASNSK